MAAFALGSFVAGAASKNVTLQQRAAVLSRGFNLPDWLKAEEGREPNREVLQELRKIGFDSVRLPVDGDRFAFDGRRSIRRDMRRLDRAIDLLLATGYAVVVDLHTSDRISGLLQETPREGAEAAAKAWEAMREVVAVFPGELVFPELLNEPPMEQQDWLSLRQSLADVVRGRCPDHTLVWGAARYQGTWETLGTPPLDDTNAIAAVHFYWPMAFTHQCSSWLDTPLRQVANLPFPADLGSAEVVALEAELRAQGNGEAVEWLNEQFASPWAASAIHDEFARVRRWSEVNECPVILNEFGVLKQCAPAVSRSAWIRSVREAAEANGMGWTYWELDQGFGLIADRQSREGFDALTLNSLFG